MNRYVKIAVLTAIGFFFFAAPVQAQTTLLAGTALEGFALDQKNTNFPMMVKITEMDRATGNFAGEVSWPSLNSIHRIEGRIQGHTVTFREVSHIKKGRAHLNCEYALVIDGRSLDGRWVEPGRDRGSVQLKIK
jgi:hypothetical protein